MARANVLCAVLLLASSACAVDSPTGASEPQTLARLKGSYDAGTRVLELGPDVAPGVASPLPYFYYDPYSGIPIPNGNVSIHTFRNYESELAIPPGSPVADTCDANLGGCAPSFGQNNLGNCPDHVLCAFVAAGCSGLDGSPGWTVNSLTVQFQSFTPPTSGITPVINVNPDGSGGLNFPLYPYGNVPCTGKPDAFLGSNVGASNGFQLFGPNGLNMTPGIASGWFIRVPTDESFTFNAIVSGSFIGP